MKGCMLTQTCKQVCNEMGCNVTYCTVSGCTLLSTYMRTCSALVCNVRVGNM